MYFARRSRIVLGSFVFALSVSAFSLTAYAQEERERVVERPETRPSERTVDPENGRSGLGNKILVVKNEEKKDLVKKTSSSALTNAKTAANTNSYSATVRSMMLRSIKDKIGTRYVYGTQGPNSYDCSGFVWKVFEDAGLSFTRTSAREYWRTFEEAEGDDRFKFGTLVFFNRLGHVGIVVDKEGFYHASTSKGVTYSKFEGYWEKRIVGYRRVPLSALVFGEDAK